MGALEIVSWMVFGLLAGGLAKLIMPGKDPGGCLVTILLGIAGALLGGYLAETLLGFGQVRGFGIRSLLVAILGAVLLLVLYRLIFGWGARRFEAREPGPD